MVLRIASFLAVGVLALEVAPPRVVLIQETSEESAIEAKLAHLEQELRAAEQKHATKLTFLKKLKHEAEIQPTLTPKSDKKFFGKDYPSDLRPAIDASPKWNYPYPKIQSDEKYDSDYVRDENNDGGHWKAQMDYDTLKMQYAKQKAVVDQAAAKSELEGVEAATADSTRDGKESEAGAASEKAKQSSAEAAKSGADAAEADKELADASDEKKAKESEAEAAEADASAPAKANSEKDKEVLEAEQQATAAELHMKDCQKALDDARANLKQVLANSGQRQSAAAENEKAAKRQNADAKRHDVETAKSKESEKAEKVKAKQSTKATGDTEAAAAQKEADARRKEADDAQSAAQKEEAEAAAAKSTRDHEQEKLDKLASDLEDAENRLRKFRGEQPLPKKTGNDLHAETKETKSAALRISTCVFALALALLVAAA